MHTQTVLTSESKIILPILPASAATSEEINIYARFMRHIRHVPISRIEIKILAAIQFTADILDYSDAHIAKVLVDLGLCAPRMAFPADFLRFADRSLMRQGWDVGGPNAALLELKAHWDGIGEDKFAAFKGQYEFVEYRAFV